MSVDWASCSAEKKACVGWIDKYFKDCVCTPKGEISFALGIVSLLCWGIAEIPQIITNYQSKSGHGVSLTFLFTWVIGDIFNMVGCLFEPVTLPTQLYTALLYTIATVILVVQTIYYDYFISWRKNRDRLGQNLQLDQEREALNPKLQDETKPIPTPTTHTTISSARSSPRIDMYYRSARSLASSGTPPFGRSSYSFLGPARSGPAGGALRDSSDEDDDEAEAVAASHRTSAKPSRIASRSVGYGTFIAGSASLPYQSKALREAHMVFSGKRLLEETRINSSNSSNMNKYGVVLGWIMAAIYMGGRLPQIYLNIKRGSVEGLNPLMFLFALIANATYVGSILVRSTEWTRIKDNLPWLLDAVVCVLLDLLIILQYAYYKFKHRRMDIEDEDYEEQKGYLSKDIAQPTQ